MGNNKKKIPAPSTSLSTKWVQLLSWFLLFSMLVTDKLMNIPEPPIPEHWYGIVFGVASASKLLEMLKIKG